MATTKIGRIVGRARKAMKPYRGYRSDLLLRAPVPMAPDFLTPLRVVCDYGNICDLKRVLHTTRYADIRSGDQLTAYDYAIIGQRMSFFHIRDLLAEKKNGVQPFRIIDHGPPPITTDDLLQYVLAKELDDGQARDIM